MIKEVIKLCGTDAAVMPSAMGKRYSVDELRAIVAPIAKKYGVRKVYVFGSIARGDYNENSDYDFYIELSETWGFSVCPVFSKPSAMLSGTRSICRTASPSTPIF